MGQKKAQRKMENSKLSNLVALLDLKRKGYTYDGEADWGILYGSYCPRHGCKVRGCYQFKLAGIRTWCPKTYLFRKPKDIK